MHKRLFPILLLSAAAFFGSAFAARAEGPAPSFFEMSDGRFYDPKSGVIAESKGQLLKLLGEPQPVPEVVLMPVESATATIPAAPASLQSAVLRARALLQQQIDADTKKKPDVVTSYDVWVDVTLAIWNAQTDEIHLVKARKNGTGLKVESENPDMGIKVKKNNGVNSEFALSDGGESVVVAVRYPIFKDISVSKKKPRYELHDVLYTPYSEPLHQPEIVAWGRETLRASMNVAYESLRQAGIRSRAYPDRLLVDVIDPMLVESIALIEHLGENALFGPNARAALESIYVVLGTNQRDAYAYARSTAGARGLVQFIPSTYALMVKRAELGLIKDFEKGMSDPVNAIKAQIAYLDVELAGMPLAVKDLYYVNNDRVIEYLAASYNTGGTRVRRAIVQWGDEWSDPHTQEIAALAKKKGAKSAAVTKMKAGTLLTETVIYVKKLRQAMKMLAPPELPVA